MHWGNCLFLPLACAGLMVGCGDSSDSSSNPSKETVYNASVVRTTHGTAHIQADNYGSLGFGQGYAFAEDRFCTLMDQIVKVRSERSKFFGPGEGKANIASDIAYLSMDVQRRAKEQVALLGDDPRDMLEGYVAGFNRYLSDTGADNLPGDCAAAPWVSSITDQDLMAYYLDLATLAGTRQVLPALANAVPAADQTVAMASPLGESFAISKDHASNGAAIGRDLSASNGGVLLSNTHLPWEDELKYHEVHLTIPGEVDVAGVSLSGAIGVQIGFNQNMAWTHTTSPSNQFIVYKLDLAADDPTAYMVDGKKVQMTSREVSIDVAGLDTPYTQTVYSSEFGPLLRAPTKGLTWNNTQAFAIHDMNIDNGGFLATFLKMAKAQSVRELKDVFEANGGVPWNHTMATDSNGEAFYADTTFVPFLLPAVESQYFQAVDNNVGGAGTAYKAGLVILPGNTSLTKPIEVPGVRVAGSVPFERAPQTISTDYVMNSNDNFWLPNPNEQLSAFTRLYGSPETVRSFRTRMGLTQYEELMPGQVTKESLEELLFADRSFTATLWQNQICSDNPVMVNDSENNAVDISGACGFIANWDGKLTLDSQGAVLFREALSGIKAKYKDGTIGDYFTTAFDPADPINTPSGLTPTGRDELQTGLADAVERLNDTGIALNARLGDVQFTKKGDKKIPIHGGLQIIDGAYNKVEYRDDAAFYTSTLPRMERASVVNEPTNLTEEGYLINYGSSYIMTVEFDDDGPHADALLTYSQSNHEDSEFYKDQTEMFSKKSWRTVPFSAQDVADQTLTQETVNN